MEFKNNIDQKAYDEGYSAFPTGNCLYPSREGLNGARYSWFMGFYSKQTERFADIPEYEEKEVRKK